MAVAASCLGNSLDVAVTGKMKDLERRLSKRQRQQRSSARRPGSEVLLSVSVELIGEVTI